MIELNEEESGSFEQIAVVVESSRIRSVFIAPGVFKDPLKNKRGSRIEIEAVF